MVTLTRQIVVFEPPLAPSFPLTGMELVETGGFEPPSALLTSVAEIGITEVFGSEPPLAH